MQKLIYSIIETLNTEIKNTPINYHFRFNEFKYTSEYYTTLRYEIEAVSNKDEHYKVDLISESDQVSMIESTLSTFDLIALRKQQLFIRFMESVFRILLLGINSPLIIKEVEEKLLEEEKNWNKVRVLLKEKQNEIIKRKTKGMG